MSMTIFDAWHIGKPQSIYDLTIMARCVQGIQEETRAADIAEDVVSSALLPWLRSALEFFGDDAADEFAILVGGAVSPSYCGIRGEPHGYSRLRSAKAWRIS